MELTTKALSLCVVLLSTAASHSASTDWMELVELRRDDGAHEVVATGVAGEVAHYTVVLEPVAYPAALHEISFFYTSDEAESGGGDLEPVALSVGYVAMKPPVGVQLRGVLGKERVFYRPKPADARQWVTVPVKPAILHSGYIVVSMELDARKDPGKRAKVFLDSSISSFVQVRPTALTELNAVSDGDQNGTFDACEGLYQVHSTGTPLLRARVSNRVLRGYNLAGSEPYGFPDRCAEAASPLLSVSVVPRRASVAQGEPIVVDVTLTNCHSSDLSFDYPYFLPGRTLSFSASREGESLAGREFRPVDVPAFRGSVVFASPSTPRVLAPGDQWTTRVLLFEFADVGEHLTASAGTVHLRADFENGVFSSSSAVTSVVVTALPGGEAAALPVVCDPVIVSMLEHTADIEERMRLYPDEQYSSLGDVIQDSAELAPWAHFCLGHNYMLQAVHSRSWPDGRSQNYRTLADTHLSALSSAPSDFPLRATGRASRALLEELKGDIPAATALATQVLTDAWATAGEVRLMQELLGRHPED